MLQRTVVDGSSTDRVVSLRGRTTPPNRAFMDEKTLFHVVPEAQYPVGGPRVPLAEPRHLRPGVESLDHLVGLGVDDRPPAAVQDGVAVLDAIVGRVGRDVPVSQVRFSLLSFLPGRSGRVARGSLPDGPLSIRPTRAAGSLAARRHVDPVQDARDRTRTLTHGRAVP